MNKYESPYPDSVGYEVAPTLSFANSHVLRIDTNYEQGPISRRVITYPVTGHKIEEPIVKDAEDLARSVLEPSGMISQTLPIAEIRDSLAQEGLVLGRKIDDQNPDYVSYVVPGSARPAKYDAPHEGDGPFSYGDSNLFGDMGYILARLALTGPEHPVVIDRAVGLNTAIVEFTRINERKLLLVPGFELNLSSVQDDDAATKHYAKKLQSEFGDRFARNYGSFIENFSRVFGGLLDSNK